MAAVYKAQHNFESRIDLAKSIPISSPLVIYVEVSSFCNLECGFCPQHLAPSEIPKAKMGMKRFEEMCKQIKEFKEKPKLIRFCGIGDSLTNKDFAEMVEIASAYSIGEKMQLITNGILLKNTNIEKLLKHLDQIVVSIEGLSNEDYKLFSNREIDYQQHVDELRRLCSIKERKCKFNIKIHSGAVKTDERLELFKKTFEFADEIYVENLVDLWPELKSDMNNNPMNNHRFLNGQAKEVIACPQIFKSLQVNANGVVVPCCIDWSAKNNLGNIDSEKLVDIWEGEKLKELRLKHLRNERSSFLPCSQCTMNEFSEYDSIDSELEAIEKKLNSQP